MNNNSTLQMQYHADIFFERHPLNCQQWMIVYYHYAKTMFQLEQIKQMMSH